MSWRNKESIDQGVLPFMPVMRAPVTMVPGARPNEWTLKVGKPEQIGPEVTIAEAALILGLSDRRVTEMCDEGTFKEGEDWRQPGGRKGKIFLQRAAVEKRRHTSEGENLKH